MKHIDRSPFIGTKGRSKFIGMLIVALSKRGVPVKIVWDRFANFAIVGGDKIRITTPTRDHIKKQAPHLIG